MKDILTILFLVFSLSAFSQIEKSYIKYNTTKNARNSDGTLMVLNATTYIVIYTKFRRESGDLGTSDIHMRITVDGGKNWQDWGYVAKAPSFLGLVSVSAIKTAADSTLIVFAKRTALYKAEIVKVWATNNYSTFSAPINITSENAYVVPANDRLFRTASGRLILGAFWLSDLWNWYAGTEKDKAVYYYSDNNGTTWTKSASVLSWTGHDLDEPTYVQLANGNLLSYIRTYDSLAYKTVSANNGTTWGAISPTTLQSPAAPQLLYKLSTGRLICFHSTGWNPAHFNKGERTPLRISVSDNDGDTWETKLNLESNTPYDFSYASCVEYEGSLYVTYYEMIRSLETISLKFAKIPISLLAD